MEKLKVLIRIDQGVVTIVEEPEGVDVEVRDYDTDTFNGDEDELLTDEDGEKYFLVG